jgi:rfaE bifunctional protein nucleotidyltransferase chain/domain
MPDCRNKIRSLDALLDWRKQLRAKGLVLVVTNGCFDLLHAGHVSYLQEARNLGDALLVGLNSDDSVRELKGPDRPINTEADRALVVAALECVNAVSVFRERSAENLLRAVQPDIYVKGGDYTVETIPQNERRVVESAGGRIVFLPFVPGKSTSALAGQLGFTTKAKHKSRQSPRKRRPTKMAGQLQFITRAKRKSRRHVQKKRPTN